MQAKYKWLLVPPALALLLFLGPLHDNRVPTQETHEEGKHEGTGKREESKLAALPSIWQIGSTLLGVLLLGGVVVMVMARVKRGGAAGTRHLALRESLRLSAKNSLHLVQFDGRVLLLGECEGKLSCLQTAPDPEVASDEAAVREEEEGATPRDMIIPRPPQKNRALADFRTLLRRARVATEQG